MEFVTIHDLSRELNTPARVIRYRLINLIAEQKLKEHEDFRRDDFKDDRHFSWKINPLRFMELTGLKPAKTLGAVDTKLLSTDNKIDNQPMPSVNNSVDHSAPSVNEVPKPVAQADNKVDTKPSEPTLAREMIDLLKDQIRVKDGQLREQGEQLKETHELNVKLTDTMLQQSQKIETLMRLAGGKSEMDDTVTKNGSFDNSTDNETNESGYQTGNDSETKQTI